MSEISTGYSGIDIEKLKYCALEVVPKNIDNPTSADIKRGLFMGLCLRQLLDQSVVTFVLLKKDKESVAAINLKFFDIITIIMYDGEVSESNYYKALDVHQENAFEQLSDVLGTMVDQNRVTKNKDIIDVDSYIFDAYSTAFKDVDSLFPAGKNKSAKTPESENIGVHTSYKPKTGTDTLTKWERERIEREKIEAEHKRLKRIPVLIRKRADHTSKHILAEMFVKITQISTGTYTPPELPEIVIKEDSTTEDDDKDSHIQEQTNNSTQKCAEAGKVGAAFDKLGTNIANGHWDL